MTTTRHRTDLAVLDQTGRVALLVEVKSRPGVSRDWAVALHRNLLAHGFAATDLPFLLATPETLYVWLGEADPATPLDSPPSLELDAADALRPYLDRLGLVPTAVGGDALELLVGEWLSDLSRIPPHGGNGAGADATSWLRLLRAIHGGTVAFESAA